MVYILSIGIEKETIHIYKPGAYILFINVENLYKHRDHTELQVGIKQKRYIELAYGIPVVMYVHNCRPDTDTSVVLRLVYVMHTLQAIKRITI